MNTETGDNGFHKGHKNFMSNEFELKKIMVDIGKRVWTRGYVASNDGNFTVRINDKFLLTTPSGISKGFMTPEMILKTDYDGNPVSGSPKFRPSSEIKMHLEVYRQRPDVKAVVHVHPPYCTSFAVAGIPLDKCVLPEAVIVLGAVPIADYGLPSTMEIPEAIRGHIKNSDAVLLANHGALTLGRDLYDAYHKMETLEHTAHIVWNAMQIGQVNVLPRNEADRLMALRDTYNVSGRTTACDATPVKNIPLSKNADPAPDRQATTIDENMVRKIIQQVIDSLNKK